MIIVTWKGHLGYYASGAGAGAFWSVFIDIVPNFDTMHSGSDQDWSDWADA